MAKHIGNDCPLPTLDSTRLLAKAALRESLKLDPSGSQRLLTPGPYTNLQAELFPDPASREKASRT